ncbi:MAG: endonuclease domain-containing protein [Bacteroidota bacterium]
MDGPIRYQAILHNLPYLREKRRALRKRMTPCEQLVWLRVRKSQLGLRIRRQHSIGNFIVDFYCARRGLIIEIDGKYHEDPMVALYDEYREHSLREMGFDFLRFKNEEVLTNLDQVIEQIFVVLHG